MNALPLHGLRVVALEQAVAAPFCSRQLADMGADVIKVERPDGGDFARGYDGALNGLSAYFAWLNRGKRSIVLDLKRDEDLNTFARLIDYADVFIHNLAPGTVERLGFGYDALKASHPRLIWCGISGYGPDGPYRDKKAYDLLIQAESGVVSVTGTADDPAKVGISIADITAGLYSYSSILTALLQREHTGRGERIDISMFECLTEWMMPPIYVWQGTGRIPARVGVRHNMIVPYGAYHCADGSVNFSIQNEREWSRFCHQVLQLPQLATDERFASNAQRLQNRVELETLIEQQFASLTIHEVIMRLDQANIANGVVNDVPAVVNHPQLAERERWVDVSTPNGMVSALLPPHNLRGVSPNMGAVPALGEHNRQILAELAELEARKDTGDNR
jgi:itaconate CoA-transferase